MTPRHPADTGDLRAHARPYKLPPNLLEYFRVRYGFTGKSIVSTLQETFDGPLGSITVFESLPSLVTSAGGTPEQRVRRVGRAFLENEAPLLDIADLAEIGERELLFHDGGKASITYQRTVGGVLLADMHINMRLGRDGTIEQIHATLVPVSSGLCAAVRRATISKAEVQAIVHRDLAEPGGEAALVIGEPTLDATWRPPYVRWTATGSLKAGKPPWGYWIDAFSGRIMARSCTDRSAYLRPPRPNEPSPCG
jgi:hypothetical protein